MTILNFWIPRRSLRQLVSSIANRRYTLQPAWPLTNHRHRQRPPTTRLNLTTSGEPSRRPYRQAIQHERHAAKGQNPKPLLRNRPPPVGILNHRPRVPHLFAGEHLAVLSTQRAERLAVGRLRVLLQLAHVPEDVVRSCASQTPSAKIMGMRGG